MSPNDHSGDWTIYTRLALLLAGWASAGLLLYALTLVLPPAALALLVVAAWAIVRFDSVSRKNKSLASYLCAITCLLTALCAVALRITRWHEDTLWRLIFVGICLGAGLICLDRQADDWQP